MISTTKHCKVWLKRFSARYSNTSTEVSEEIPLFNGYRTRLHLCQLSNTSHNVTFRFCPFQGVVSGCPQTVPQYILRKKEDLSVEDPLPNRNCFRRTFHSANPVSRLKETWNLLPSLLALMRPSKFSRTLKIFSPEITSTDT